VKFPIWFSAALIGASVATATAKPQSASHRLSPAENWVIAQVNAGEVADLSKQFLNEDERKLSAHFVENLLTAALPGVKLHRHGVRIIGASINEPIDLENAQIPCEVWLEHCQFNANATFDGASFAGTISFENSAFNAEASFNSVKVGRAVFSDAVFEGPVGFVLADIAGNFEADGAKFQNKEKTANFNGMKVRGYASFYSAVFEGPVDFGSTAITGNFEAQTAKFQNKEKGASFNSMKVGGDAFFFDTEFEGPVIFILADIASNFIAQGAKFQNKETEANFNRIKVRGYAFFFNGAVFEGRANFGSADIASTFSAERAKFQNKEKEADFSGMKVGGYVFFNGAVFEGPANFILADIARAFAAKGAKFQNNQREANFYSMKVGGDTTFDSAAFEGPVNFGSADVAADFKADGAKFQSKQTEANFNSMKVKGDASFGSAIFEGPVNFGLADIARNFQAQLAKFQNKEQTAHFNGMKVGGRAFFNQAVFEGPVDLRYADFAWLDLSGASWPKAAAQFNLQGMGYKYIRAASKEPQSHKALLNVADQSAYSADVYSHLEEFFLRQGYRADADDAFIKGKRRERRENLHGLGRLDSYLLDWLVGYGRRPWQAGIPCAALVALGCVLFSPKKMERQKPEDTPRVYSRFWYSLDLFLPFVDLQADDVWKPKTNERFLRHYVRLHVMLGWILIPIVLAALTGLIK
jgi:hypothetical protein